MLLKNDQLEKNRQTSLPKGFIEGAIEFPPTYKFLKNQPKYDLISGRNPGWTDRIIYKSKVSSALEQVCYDAVSNLYWSDHRPVFSQFDVQVTLDQKEV